MATGPGSLTENDAACMYWETNVNLSPPKAWGKDAPNEDEHLQTYYNALQRILYETGQPETIDRTQRPRKLQNKERVNVAILSPPGKCLGILLEGGNQLPDGFHLVLSTSWLSKTPSEEDSSLNTLLLHKSISFHASGASFIEEFEPPRRVTYFINNFTKNVIKGRHDHEMESEIDLDCPMGSSAKLSEAADDIVWTRDIMAEAGMEIPETLAIRRRPTRNLSYIRNKIKCIDFDNYDSLDMAQIEREILKFSNRLEQSGIKKIFIKASRPMHHGDLATSVHNCDDTVAIFEFTKELLKKLEKRCSVIVEELVETVLPLEDGIKQAKLWSANGGVGFRTQVTVCRDHDGTPVTTLIKCAVTERFCSTRDENIVWQSLESTLVAFNVFDEVVREELERKIRAQSAAVLMENIVRESLLAVDGRGRNRAQTDVIGIDIKVTLKGGKLVPVGITFNNLPLGTGTLQYSFMMNLGERTLVQRRNMTRASSPYKKTTPMPSSPYNKTKPMPSSPYNKTTPMPSSDLNVVKKTYGQDMHEDNGCISCSNTVTETEKIENGFMKYNKNIHDSRYYTGDTLGQSIRPLVRNMISRSQRYIMKGKQIIMIGGSSIAKRTLWPTAAIYGVKVIMVEADPNHKGREHVYRFIQYSFDDNRTDEEHADEITNLIKEHDVKADACLTFRDKNVPLTILINKRLGKKSIRYEAALTARKKSRTQNLLNTRRTDIPLWPPVNLYSTLAVHLKTEADCSAIPESFKFPAMLKLETGSYAIAAAIVKNRDELKNRFVKVTNSPTDSGVQGVGNSMMAMEFYEGSEHNVDVMIFDRKLVGAIITDSGRVRRPYFTATGRCMPLTLPSDKQAQLIAASYQCCIEIGLSHGSYNVEMMMTAAGPKLLEINPRIGGYLFRAWALKVHGVDPAICAMMIASDIKPYIPQHPANTVLMGVMLLPSTHANTWEDERFKSLLNQMIEREEIIVTQFREKVQTADPGYEIAFGNIAVSAPTADQAKTKLISVCRTLGIDKENYRVEEIIKPF